MHIVAPHACVAPSLPPFPPLTDPLINLVPLGE